MSSADLRKDIYSKNDSDDPYANARPQLGTRPYGVSPFLPNFPLQMLRQCLSKYNFKGKKRKLGDDDDQDLVESVRTISALFQTGDASASSTDPHALETQVASISAELAAAIAQAKSRAYDDDEEDEDEDDEESRAAVDRVLQKYERAKVQEDDKEGDFDARYELSIQEKMAEWKRGYYKVSTEYFERVMQMLIPN